MISAYAYAGVLSSKSMMWMRMRMRTGMLWRNNANNPSCLMIQNVCSSTSTSTSSTGNKEDVWTMRLQELREYRLKFGHSAVPREQYGGTNSNTSYDKTYKQLGNWVQRLRVSRKRRKLSADQISELDREQFVWDVHETSFEEKLDALKSFREEHGHITVPDDYEKVPGLYAWMTQQRYVSAQLVKIEFYDKDY